MRSLLLLVLFLTTGASYAQQYNFRNWTLEQGLPQSKVVAVLQNEKKFLWIATRGGVSRFDGYTFQTFTKSQGLSSNNVSTLFQDSHQQLWIGTADNGLNKFDGRNFIYFGKHTGLPDNGITGITEDLQGKIWVATSSGLFYLKEGTFYLYAPLPAQAYTALLYTSDGSLWAASKAAGLYHIKDKQIHHYSTKTSALPANEVTAISQGKDRKLWIGTIAGIAVIQDDSMQVIPDVTHAVTGFAHDLNGQTWVACKNNGLLKIKGDNVTSITKENGLRTNNIVSIATDVENNIWIGTNGYGLQQYRAPWFLHYFQIGQVTEPRISSLTRDDEGTIWVGTDNGQAAFLQKENLLPFNWKELPSSTSIYGMLVNNSKDMWIGTSNGVWRLLNGSYRHYTIADGLPSDEVRVITRDAGGNLWFATANGVAQYINNRFETVRTEQGPLGHVYCIFTDSKGKTWFGTEKGIYNIQNGKIRKAEEVSAPTLKDITSITEDTEGTLYFGGFNYGILAFNPAKSLNRLFSTADGLPNDGIKSLLVDNTDHLWVGTNNNMLKIDLPQLRQYMKLVFKRYNNQDGFRGLEICHGCILQTTDSTLWFGTSKGLSKYLAPLDMESNVYPELLLTDIKLFMRPTNWKEMGYRIDSVSGLPQNLVLPFNRNHITFDFHGISLSNPTRVKYRYKLTGYDEQWTDVTETSSATYANLDPGKYTFNVIAQNNNGPWTVTPLLYPFSVNAPLWRREWFMGLMLLIISGSILTVIRLRERGLKKMNRLLDLRVQHRTRLLERKHQEKEMLLKEIHHRVKNNLQIVISLLNLQARHVKDTQAQEAMQAIRSRVRAMSLLHERLYQYDNLAHINLENYFREICQGLYNAFGVTEENITLNLRIPPIKLDIDTAITLGLIVNELVSNSLKYAFVQGQQGQICITLEQQYKTRYMLVVQDNGIGLPGDTDNQEDKSFGLKLVASLSSKLGGKIAFENNNGTKTILCFVLPS